MTTTIPDRKASADAWILLACAVKDDPFEEYHKKTGGMPRAANKKNLHQNMCGEGFDPRARACFTPRGKQVFNLAAKHIITPADLGYTDDD